MRGRRVKSSAGAGRPGREIAILLPVNVVDEALDSSSSEATTTPAVRVLVLVE